MRVLAIVPARGGSKGVPGKNLRPLAGRPLIVWSIASAKRCAGLTDTVVTTDDPEIARVAREAGAEAPFLRPSELARDESPTEPAMAHALAEMEARKGRYDAVMLLQPTSPLRFDGSLDRALHQFANEGADSLLGVVESHAFFWRETPEVQACYDFTRRPRRQDIAPEDRRLRETGSLYISTRDAFVASGNRLSGRVALFKMAEEEGWEIDSLADFAVLEALFHHAGLAVAS
jgi:CMP-N,N'-diacetyllegionaminic acid synthase